MVNTFMSYGKCILDFLLFFWLSMQFFIRRWEKYKIMQYMLLIILAAFIFYINKLHIPQLNTLTAFVCALTINFILFKGSIVSRLLCSIAEVLIIVVCEFIPISVYSLIYKRDIAAITNETIRNAGFNLIGTFIFCIIIMLIRHFIILKKKNNDKAITITENIAIIIVPLVSMFIIYYILDVGSTGNAVNAISAWQSIIILMGILVMNFAVIISDNSLRKRYQLQAELDRLSRLEELNRIAINQQDQFINDMKGFAHDYNKQMDGLKSLIQEAGTANHIGDELQKYTDEMHNSIKDSYRFMFISTPALRSILSQTFLRCKTAQIAFNIDIQYADFNFIAFPDIYSIFENPLDNAVTACSDIHSNELNKEINLKIVRKNNIIGIDIRNTRENSILIKNGCIQSTKTDPNGHGMGIKNMKRAIQQYEGYITINYDENIFHVSMTIPISKI